MSFHIVTGITYEDVFGEILRRIGERKRDLGVRNLLIVPDRFTLIAEEALLDSEPFDGCMDVEVLSFNRLSVKLTGKSGILDHASSCILFSKLLADNADGLKAFRGSGSELSALLYDTVMQFKASGISPDDLGEVAGRLKSKLSDIQLIYSEYEKHLKKNNLTDCHGRIDRLVNCIPLLGKFNAYFALHDTLTKPMLAVVDAMSKWGESVTLGAIKGLNEALFSNSLYEKVLTHGEERGIEHEISDVFCRDFFAKELLERAYKSNSPVLADKPSPYVVFSAESSEEEMEILARTISGKVRREGLKYSDIAIYYGEKNAKVLSETLSKYGIPHFVDTPRLLEEHPLCGFLVGILEVRAKNFRSNAVEGLLMNPYSRIKKEDREVFINYCRKFNIDYSRFVFEFDKGGELECGASEIVRKRLVEIVGQNKMSTSEYLQKLTVILRELPRVYEKSNNEAEEERAFLRMEELLECVKSTLNGAEYNLNELVGIIKSGASNVRLTILPPYADGVYAGRHDCFRGKRHKVLFVIGANLGVLPIERSDAGIVTDRDIAELKGLGRTLEPLIREVNDNNRYEFIHSLTTADQVYISFTERPSQAVMCLTSIFSLKIYDGSKIYDNMYSDEESLVKYLSYAYPTREVLRTALSDAVLRKYPSAEANAIFEALGENPPSLPKEGAIDGEKLLLPDKKISVSRLEAYFECPYKHFLKYGVETKINEEGGLNALDIGNILHFVAEEFLRDGLPIPDEKYADSLVDKWLADNSVEEKGSMLRRIKEDAFRLCLVLKEESMQSDYKCKAVERKFGAEGEPQIIIPAKNGNVSLVGKIDRVDENGNYVRVIDYKTSRYAGLTLSEVYYGRKLQLLLYLKALTDMDKGKIPAAALYFPISEGFEQKESSVFRGFLLKDKEQLAAMDKEILGDGEQFFPTGKYINARLRKDKKIGVTTDGRIGRGSIFSAEEFYDLMDYAVRVAGVAVDEIGEGTRCKKPASGVCGYCEMNAACYNLAGNERKKILKIDIKSFGECE